MLQPTTTDPQGNPVYVRVAGAGFFIVVEAKPGTSGRPPGVNLDNSDPTNPGARPDLQLIANRNLGNGSPTICDAPPNSPIGGVPGINPPTFDPGSQLVANALNDFACRFDLHVPSSQACTLTPRENFGFVATDTTTQMCSRGVVGHEMLFPFGDTLLTVQWRDTSGNIGLARRIVVRVLE